jgi:hypothetical protein
MIMIFVAAILIPPLDSQLSLLVQRYRDCKSLSGF